MTQRSNFTGHTVFSPPSFNYYPRFDMSLTALEIVISILLHQQEIYLAAEAIV